MHYTFFDFSINRVEKMLHYTDCCVLIIKKEPLLFMVGNTLKLLQYSNIGENMEYIDYACSSDRRGGGVRRHGNSTLKNSKATQCDNFGMLPLWPTRAVSELSASCATLSKWLQRHPGRRACRCFMPFWALCLPA